MNNIQQAISCLVILQLSSLVFASTCAVRKYSSESSVCVCNSTYCDTIDLSLPDENSVMIFTSSKDGLRFDKTVKSLLSLQKNVKRRDASVSIISINPNVSYQTIKGFGGAMTDATAINVMSLSLKTQNNFLASYFGKSGIEYNMARVPMASCDFSTHEYTYLDSPNDFNLSTFHLTTEDINMKIPLLKRILSISSKPVSLYASPWTAPAWMKTNKDEIGRGRLQGKAGDKYHKTWAEYFTKFLDEYKKAGINFWGITMQNEPSNGYILSGSWQCMGWSPSEQRDFVKTDLGPMLKAKNYGNIKLMIHDDQRLFMPTWPKEILSDPDAAKFVSGVAVHWYWDWLVGPGVISDTHNLFPDKFILATEACVKTPPTKEFGSWKMGEQYSDDVMDNLNNWAIGWVDWNMCLNLKGGPNWVNNFDNSPIIVNATADEFYKQPMYYHLGHFSKFIPEGSLRLKAASDTKSNIKFVAILRPDGYIVIVILNKENNDVNLNIAVSVPNKNSTVFGISIPKRAIQTYIRKNSS